MRGQGIICVAGCIAMVLVFFTVAAVGAEATAHAELSRLIADVAGPDATAESRAARRLVELGDSAVPALAELTRNDKTLAPRLIAVELLGRIGSPAALDALLVLLPPEKNLAVRGQICMQLGYLGKKRAVPIIGDWLKTIGPRANGHFFCLGDAQAPATRRSDSQ